MPPLLTFSITLLYALLAVADNAQHKIHKYKHKYKAHADNQRLNKALASSPSSSNFPEVVASLATTDTTNGFQLYSNAALPTNPAPSTACAAALTSSLTCNATIQYMQYATMDTADLTAVCMPVCYSSLQSYRSAVTSACSGFRFPGVNNSTYDVTLAVDLISEPYFTQCRTDTTTGKFCSDVLMSYTTTSPNQGILGYPVAELCSSCMLGLLNTTLSSPITYSNAMYDTLQSALKTCGSSWASYNVSTAPKSFFIPATSATPLGSNITIDASCALIGHNITVASNSTCSALSTQYSVSEPDILAANPTLQALNCTSGIRSQTQLCLPQSCTLYTPQSNQTCQNVVDDVNSKALAGSNNITVAQLQSFNPSINTLCSNNGITSGNTTICITPHGGFANIDNGGGSAVPSASPTAVVAPPGQTAPGTTSACGRWYLVQPNNFCQQVALNNSIALDDFLTLNPEVNANCTNLWANYYYCVAPYPPFNQATTTGPIITANFSSATLMTIPLTTATATTPLPVLPSYTGMPAPTNLAGGTIANGCGYYYNVNAGDNCTSVEQYFNITDTDFKNYNENPSVPCPSLTVGSAVCVQVLNATDTIPPIPTNAAAGSAPSGCARWYTIVMGDGCTSVEQKFSLTAAQFFTLNPEVKTDCTNLGLGEAYCVKAIGQTGGGGSGVTIPANVVSGTDTANCTKYDTAISGDTCPIIETRNNVSDQIFRALNPEINTGCTNIQLDGAYCVQPVAGYTVGTSPPSNVVSGTDTKDCAKYDTIISGDTCPIVEARNGISDTLFRILNPEINAGCTNIQLGGAYCVKAVAGFTTTTTSTTSSQPSVPTNLASGSWTKNIDTVVSGDSCQAIDTKFKIALSDFFLWNPEITSTCSNLQLSAYCVSGSKKCAKIYTVASGDFCSKIETANDLTDAQLRSLNPWIDTNCDLQIGQNLCVG
ncbi:hypothetical protein CVT25_007028 [Psilocybe cyanescens]|uniref:LysM domain-containing protein n=1 Tax=Psilocybe cyanescens TaxID=93625 RepID=A0A409WY69_PSICY|nr:hypothetical protein CVT25_007028 [Psilocybe cyanescens]